MAVWYVHREGGLIRSLHGALQPDYAEEALDTEESEELRAFLRKLSLPKPSMTPLVKRRIMRLERQKRPTTDTMLRAINLKLSLR